MLVNFNGSTIFLTKVMKDTYSASGVDVFDQYDTYVYDVRDEGFSLTDYPYTGNCDGEECHVFSFAWSEIEEVKFDLEYADCQVFGDMCPGECHKARIQLEQLQDCRESSRYFADRNRHGSLAYVELTQEELESGEFDND